MVKSLKITAAVGFGVLAISLGVLTIRTHAEEFRPGVVAYTADGQLLFPKDFRRWVYLTSGLDMSYDAKGDAPADSTFDNVFVDPAAYAAFLKTGTWPDGAVMVLEHRQGSQRGSINQRGHFQSDRRGIEVHIKDTSRFKGGWAFFSFPAQAPAPMIPQSVACYACHTAHAAVDTTFVQFYPTLLPTAKAKATFSTAYLAEEAARTAKD